jgi:hypothetical protein
MRFAVSGGSRFLIVIGAFFGAGVGVFICGFVLGEFFLLMVTSES